MRYLSSPVLMLLFALAGPQAMAEEIIPGVAITPVSLPAPINEQPYFGFATKTEHQKQADARFIEAITVKGGATREQGGAQVAAAAGHFMGQGDWATAARRFNQAFLLDPTRSDIAHGFAIIVEARFGNTAYALELFKAAHKLREPRLTLASDHGRLLVMAGKPAEAIPLLEQAVARQPASEIPAAQLASAYLMARQPERACAALAKVPAHTNAEVTRDMDEVRRVANCR